MSGRGRNEAPLLNPGGIGRARSGPGILQGEPEARECNMGPKGHPGRLRLPPPVRLSSRTIFSPNPPQATACAGIRLFRIINRNHGYRIYVRRMNSIPSMSMSGQGCGMPDRDFGLLFASWRLSLFAVVRVVSCHHPLPSQSVAVDRPVDRCRFADTTRTRMERSGRRRPRVPWSGFGWPRVRGKAISSAVLSDSVSIRWHWKSASPRPTVTGELLPLLLRARSPRKGSHGLISRWSRRDRSTGWRCGQSRPLVHDVPPLRQGRVNARLQFPRPHEAVVRPDTFHPSGKPNKRILLLPPWRGAR